MKNNAKNNKYDIEFTGGTSVQINLKEGVNLSREEVERRIREIGRKMNNARLVSANVYSIGKTGKSYEITTTETNKTIATVTFDDVEQAKEYTVETILTAIKETCAKMGRRLTNLQVRQVSENRPSFLISTSQISPMLVKNILSAAFPKAEISDPKVDEVVNNAIKEAFADQLEILQNLGPQIVSCEKITEQFIDSYPCLLYTSPSPRD